MLALQRASSLAAILLATACVLHAETAVARLKSTAPEDVNLSGVWKINKGLSEDPQDALKERQQQARERMDAVRSVATPAVGGIVGGVVGAVLGGIANKDTAADPLTRAALEQLMKTEDQLTIEQQTRALTWKKSGSDPDMCTTGKAKPITLAGGETAKRRCGWQDGAFVVELKLPDGFVRTDRYQLAEDGNQLEISTEIKSPKGPMSSFEFKRVYDHVMPEPANTNGPVSTTPTAK
jgi:hypothetical protein